MISLTKTNRNWAVVGAVVRAQKKNQLTRICRNVTLTWFRFRKKASASSTNSKSLTDRGERKNKVFNSQTQDKNEQFLSSPSPWSLCPVENFMHGRHTLLPHGNNITSCHNTVVHPRMLGEALKHGEYLLSKSFRDKLSNIESRDKI